MVIRVYVLQCDDMKRGFISLSISVQLQVDFTATHIGFAARIQAVAGTLLVSMTLPGRTRLLSGRMTCTRTELQTASQRKRAFCGTTT